MNKESTQTAEQTQSESKTRTDALAKVVTKVQADAANGSQEYLDDSIVPEGGE